MTTRPGTHLDAFEQRLLAELKAVAAAQGETGPRVLGSARRREHHGRWYLPTAGVAVAAAVGIAVVAVNTRPMPAYAVSGGNGKQVTVQVNRLEGADALERALRKRGIAANITYLAPGRACAPGRYLELRTPGLTLSVSAARFTVIIPPGAVPDDGTFVLSAAVRPLDHGVQAAVEFGVTRGVVAPCFVVVAT